METFFLDLFFNIFSDVYSCVSVCNFVHVSVGALRSQKRSSETLELENIQPIVSHLTAVLRTELRPSGRTGRTLNLQAIPLAFSQGMFSLEGVTQLTLLWSQSRRKQGSILPYLLSSL